MKRLQLSRALSPTEATNSALVTRTKRLMRGSLLTAALKHGPARARDIRLTEYDETLATEDGEPLHMHIISMRIDVP